MMTEAEWLACADPEQMLDFLHGKASERKLRLFAVACCRRVWHLLSDSSREGVDVIEHFAERQTTSEQLAQVHRAARRKVRDASDRSQKLPPRSLESDLAYRDSQQALLVLYAAAPTDGFVGMVALYSSQCACRELAGYRPTYDEAAFLAWHQLVDADMALQANVLRDVCGNPFRPVSANPNWLTWNGGIVPKLAQAIYDERRFQDLPILADALEEAGCTNADLLDHCRRPGEHFRGCWAVDLPLGKK
jgi:hypothetical protein